MMVISLDEVKARHEGMVAEIHELLDNYPTDEIVLPEFDEEDPIFFTNERARDTKLPSVMKLEQRRVFITEEYTSAGSKVLAERFEVYYEDINLTNNTAMLLKVLKR